MADGRVERSKNNTLGRVILDQVLLLIRVKHVLREQLALIQHAFLAQSTVMLAIPVQSCVIAVSKGMFDVVTLLIIEEVVDLITIFGCHPGVLQDLINGETGLWVSLQDL